MKFKVGDKVKVREDLEANRYYDDLRFSPKMGAYKGEIITIQAINYKRPVSYVANGWHWNDEMVESVKEENKINKNMKEMKSKTYKDFWEEIHSEVFPDKKNSQDKVNHPSHYNQGKYEVIEEMRLRK